MAFIASDIFKHPPFMSSDQRRHRFLTILCFTLVYFFWGSTYLGIDIAVEQFLLR